MEDRSVAVLMTTYNGDTYVEAQIDSIINQTYSNWVMYISDDGSTDKTLRIVQKYVDAYQDKIILLPEHEPSGGACQNFFHLMKTVPIHYDYYAFSDQDDVWDCRKLELSCNKLIDMEMRYGRDAPLLSFCDAEVVDEELSLIAESFIDFTGVNPENVSINELLVQNPVSGAGILINAELLKVATMPETLAGISMHDQWLALVASLFGKIEFIDMPLYKYRQHGNNEVGAVEMSLRSVLSKARIAKKSLKNKKTQAAKLSSTYAGLIDSNEKALVDGFAQISTYNKLSRISFLISNHIFMNGFLRNIGLFFAI